MLSDFNCQILDTQKFKPLFNSAGDCIDQNESLIKDIELLGSLGFHRLICQVPYDPNSDVLYYTFRKIRFIEKHLKQITSRKISGRFQVSAFPVTYLNKDTPYLRDLNKILVPNTNYLFLELPWGHFPDSLAVSINKLLYEKKLLPIFSNFHIYLAIYNAQAISKLINIRYAGFQFPLNAEVLSKHLLIIKHIIGNGGVILLGTSCDHFTLNEYEIRKSLDFLQKRLSKNEYSALILRARALLK